MKKQQKKKLLTTSKEVAATETNNQETKQEVAADSRRTFLRNGLLAAAGFYIVPRNVLGRGFTAPSDKLQIAGIGAGGKGELVSFVVGVMGGGVRLGILGTQ